MSLRDVLAFFGVARKSPQPNKPQGYSTIFQWEFPKPVTLSVRASPDPRGVQRLPVPVMASNGVSVRGFYERLGSDDARRHCLIHTHDSFSLGYVIDETEVEIHGYQPEDCVAAYLRFLADWEAAHR